MLLPAQLPFQIFDEEAFEKKTTPTYFKWQEDNNLFAAYMLFCSTPPLCAPCP